MSLAGRRVLITGGAGGIGSAIARAACAAGAGVGLAYRRSREAAQALATDLIEAGADVTTHALDVSDAAQVQDVVAAFIEHHGRIDGLVNNAGVTHPGLLATQSSDDIEAMVATNLLGAVWCARAVLRPMLRQRAGVILNLGSVTAVRPSRGQAVYAATKGALESFTRALAVEYGRKGIRAVCLRPGAIDTPMLAPTLAADEAGVIARIPTRRVGLPADIADAAVFLLGDGARYVTGETLTVDGGMQVG